MYHTDFGVPPRQGEGAASAQASAAVGTRGAATITLDAAVASTENADVKAAVTAAKAIESGEIDVEAVVTVGAMVAGTAILGPAGGAVAAVGVQAAIGIGKMLGIGGSDKPQRTFQDVVNDAKNLTKQRAKQAITGRREARKKAGGEQLSAEIKRAMALVAKSKAKRAAYKDAKRKKEKEFILNMKMLAPLKAKPFETLVAVFVTGKTVGEMLGIKYSSEGVPTANAVLVARHALLTGDRSLQKKADKMLDKPAYKNRMRILKPTGRKTKSGFDEKEVVYLDPMRSIALQAIAVGTAQIVSKIDTDPELSKLPIPTKARIKLAGITIQGKSWWDELLEFLNPFD